MKSIFDYVVDDNPYHHPMLTPVTAFGTPTEHSHTETPSIAGEAEGERVGEKVVKEPRVSLLGFLVVDNNSTK